MVLPKNLRKKVALERIEILFAEAKKAANKNLSLSQRYVSLARKLSMRYKVKIPIKYKKLFCKKCKNYFIAGKTLRVRSKNKKLVYYCYNCKRVIRYPFRKN